MLLDNKIFYSSSVSGRYLESLKVINGSNAFISLSDFLTSKTAVVIVPDKGMTATEFAFMKFTKSYY